MHFLTTAIIRDRHAVVSLEFAVLAAFIAGTVMVVGGAVGTMTLRAFSQIVAML